MGGGGGGGGRIMFQFNASTHTTSQERFDGRYHALGGKQGGQIDFAGNRTHDGADGTVWTSLAPCKPGWGSVFCTECPQGSYKNTTDVSLCVPCQNAPEHANYTQRGYIDANCPYECNEGFRGKDCLTPFEEFLRQLGGPVVLIVAFLLVVVVVAIISLVIVQYNSRIRCELPGRNPSAAVQAARADGAFCVVFAGHQSDSAEGKAELALSHDEHAVRARGTALFGGEKYFLQSMETSRTPARLAFPAHFPP